MRKRHKALLVIFGVILGIPLILWLSWLITTPRPVSVFIMDKTSYSELRAKNRALNWVLTHNRFVKTQGGFYQPTQDYYGFFPVSNSEFRLNDLSGLTSSQIRRKSINYHMAYYTDSYGVYTDMWPEENPAHMPARKIYGGLHKEDLELLEYMKESDKLIIAEFIFMSPPDNPAYRNRAEELFGMEWQGWTGRFFHTFDPQEEKSVPPWVPVLYENQNNKSWNPQGSGVIFVHEDETLVVLRKGEHLNTAYPEIITAKENRQEFGVSNRVYYPGWFDITYPVNSQNGVLSWFELDLTQAGESLLDSYGLSGRFPAVIMDTEGNRQYYFSGDFGYSPLNTRFVKFRGARYAELFLADLTDPTDKSGFFFTYYLPLMTKILTDYQAEIVSSR